MVVLLDLCGMTVWVWMSMRVCGCVLWGVGGGLCADGGFSPRRLILHGHSHD